MALAKIQEKVQVEKVIIEEHKKKIEAKVTEVAAKIAQVEEERNE